MSENDPFEDFSSYSGSYQSGQLLHEDGEIDLDELGDPNSTRAPLTVKLLFVLFLSLLGAGAYYVFIHNAPQVPTVQKLVKPKVDETVKKTYAALKKTKDQQFSPLFSCLMTVERNHKSDAPSLQKDLLEDCKPLAAGGVRYQLVCTDKESCRAPALGKCKGDKCEPVANVSYTDFLYALMLRYASSYDSLYALQRLYYAAQRSYKKSGKKDEASKKQMEAYIAKMSALLKNSGSTGGLSPHFVLATSKLYSQAIDYVAAIKKATGGTKGEPSKARKKRRRKRRRRRRRRRRKKAATMKVRNAGTLYLFKSFPVAALKNPGFSTLFQSERLARQASLVRKFNYTPMALHFWINMLAKHKALACVSGTKVGATLQGSFVFNTEIERMITDSIKVSEGGGSACLTKAIGHIQLFSTVADDKKMKVTFAIKTL